MAATVFDNIKRKQKGKKLKPFVYDDKGSLISLSRFSSVGSLMGYLVGGVFFVYVRMSRMIYTSLYRLHLIGIHGWLRGFGLMVIGRVNRVVRPRMKLH